MNSNDEPGRPEERHEHPMNHNGGLSKWRPERAVPRMPDRSPRIPDHFVAKGKACDPVPGKLQPSTRPTERPTGGRRERRVLAGARGDDSEPGELR